MTMSGSHEMSLVGVDMPAVGVQVLSFNRPAKRNAFSQELIDEFLQKLQRASRDPAVRIVVITGNPSCFSGTWRN